MSFLVAMIAIFWATTAHAERYSVMLQCDDGRTETWADVVCNSGVDIEVAPKANCGNPQVKITGNGFEQTFRHHIVWHDGVMKFECQNGRGPAPRPIKIEHPEGSSIGDWSLGAGGFFTGIADHKTFAGGEVVFEGNLYTGADWLNFHFEFRTGGDSSLDSDQSGWTIAEVVGLQFRFSDTLNWNLGVMHRLSLTQEGENYNAVMALMGIGVHIGGGFKLNIEGSVGNAWHQAGSSYSLLDGVRVNPAQVPAFAQDRLVEQSELLNTHSLSWGAGLRLIYTR